MKTYHTDKFAELNSPSPKHSICLEQNIGGTVVKLEQHDKRKIDGFRVTYGMEVHDECSYGEAATQFGQALMHALACQGLLDNDRD